MKVKDYVQEAYTVLNAVDTVTGCIAESKRLEQLSAQNKALTQALNNQDYDKLYTKNREQATKRADTLSKSVWKYSYTIMLILGLLVFAGLILLFAFQFFDIEQTTQGFVEDVPNYDYLIDSITAQLYASAILGIICGILVTIFINTFDSVFYSKLFLTITIILELMLVVIVAGICVNTLNLPSEFYNTEEAKAVVSSLTTAGLKPFYFGIAITVWPFICLLLFRAIFTKNRTRKIIYKSMYAKADKKDKYYINNNLPYLIEQTNAYINETQMEIEKLDAQVESSYKEARDIILSYHDITCYAFRNYSIYDRGRGNDDENLIDVDEKSLKEYRDELTSCIYMVEHGEASTINSASIKRQVEAERSMREWEQKKITDAIKESDRNAQARFDKAQKQYEKYKRDMDDLGRRINEVNTDIEKRLRDIERDS